MKLPSWLQLTKKNSSAKKAMRLLAAIRKKTSGLYAAPEAHWRIVKWGGVAFTLAIAIFGYQFYQRVNKGAFESTADVAPTGVQDINTSELLDVITTERQRSEQFGVLITDPIVSFDPAQYGVELRRASEVASSTEGVTEEESE